MPEPLSTAVGIAWLSYASLNAYARNSNAVSNEAFVVGEAAASVIAAVEQSEALFGEKSAAITDLQNLADECAEVGWDGYEGLPVDSIALHSAFDFIRALPDALPLPEFAIDPDGAVAMDWIHSKTRLFSLSFGQSNRLSYAWLDGSDRGHGVAKFTGDETPARILEGIRAITKNESSAIWS